MQAPTKSYNAHILGALFLYVMDALVVGQGLIFAVSLLALLISVTRGLFTGILRQVPFQRSRITVPLIYAVAGIAVLLTIKGNNMVAQSRAETLVVAINAYKSKYSRYPDTLQSLVPEFMDRVPKAKFTASFNEFFYSNKGKTAPLLFYTAFPPFGRPIYNFERNEWGYLD